MAAPDWRPLIAQHAQRVRLDLPPETIDELSAHLDDLYAAALRTGATVNEASARAMLALDQASFPSLERHAQQAGRRPATLEAHDTARMAANGGSFNVFYALRMAFRQFRHHRAFAIVTIMVLGLGTGAAAAVYTIVDGVVLRPLPYRAPDELVTVWETNNQKGLNHEGLSPVNFMDYRALPAFVDAAAWWRPDVSLTDPGFDPIRVNAVETSPNLFNILGVKPEFGPGFPENGPFYSRSEPLIVISDRLWRSRYSASPDVIGRQILIGATNFAVAGIMPPRFNYPGDVDVWERMRWDMTQHSRAAHFMESVARLKPGVKPALAQEQLNVLTRRLAAENAATNSGWATRLISLRDDQLGYYQPALLVLFGAVGLLLVIGCLNVASLLLTRALSRDREVAVRTALGASPRQLITQLVAESLVLSLAGALTGLIAARLSLPLIIHSAPVAIPRLDQIAINGRVLLLCLAVVVSTTMFFGLVPALVLLRRHLSADLRSGERGSSRSARRVYHVLVAGELALACALLVGSALLARTVQRMTQTETGVTSEDAITARIQLPAGAYPEWPQVTTTYARILDRIREEPGVSAAGAASHLPMEPGWRLAFSIDGVAPPANAAEAPQAQHIVATDGFFEAMGAKLAAGRAFLPSDTDASAGVVIVNSSFAKRYLPGNGVGAKLHSSANNIGPLGHNLMNGKPLEVIGVVADVRNMPLSQPIEPAIYFTARQFPFYSMALVARARDTPTALAGLKAALHDVVPRVPPADVSSWGARLQGASAQPRLLMTVLMGFSGLAALLAAVGVYGLFAWSVAVRRRELAIRLTLGAKPSGLGVLVLRQSLTLVAVGLAAGWLLIRLATPAITTVLFDVRATDPLSTASAFAVLIVAATLACGIPAVRAARTDPAQALRGD